VPGYCSVIGRASLPVALTLVAAALTGCTSTSQELTGPGSASKCAPTVAVPTREFDAEGGEGTITVSAARDCRWDVRSDAGWLTIASPAEGQGDGTARFVVASTTDPVSRTASLTVVDQQVTITQRAAPCRYRLSIVDLSVPPSGGGGEIDVTASSQLCEWTAQADADWVSIPTGRTYKGSARVSIEAPPWAGPMRRAEIAIADQRVVLTQSAGCTYSLGSSSAAMPSSAGSGSVPVQTAAGCPWSAVSSVPWVTITGGAAGSGPGVVEFSVLANSGPARSATLTIANRPFAVAQAAGCEYRLEPAAATFAAAGGPGTFAVNTAPGCAWTAASEASWITVTAGHAGSGPGAVSMSVAPNAGPQRASGVRIGGQRFTATQLSGCTYGISPTSWSWGPEGGLAWVHVTTTPDCPWTATSQADWMIVTSGRSGIGSGSVAFTVLPNLVADRAGTLTIAGHTFHGSQMGPR